MSFPNQLTILRILLTPVFVACLFVEEYNYRLAALIIFFIAVLTDWYDGYVARKFGSVTNWGKFLDPLADKILVLSAFFSLVVLGYIELWMVIVIAFRDLFITTLRIYAIKKNSKKPLKTSSWAKWKTASQMAGIYFILIYLVLKQKMLAVTDSLPWLHKLEALNFVDKLMYLVTFITATTGIHYLVENRHHVKALAHTVSRFLIPNIFLS
ncbi:MAG: CDP-diacylglycerol--glycerol-3-phosphate 3-phosphatidyltransferase [Calditrichaeota bacterium]|nr:MAG: CDP-diacylglycerol--glycerol-3-phosphate 3-phosphatidyltransferase [Calditrichota bacterium]